MDLVINKFFYGLFAINDAKIMYTPSFFSTLARPLIFGSLVIGGTVGLVNSRWWNNRNQVANINEENRYGFFSLVIFLKKVIGLRDGVILLPPAWCIIGITFLLKTSLW